MLIICNHDTPTTILSSNGITWTFSGNVTFGQFVTGDYWVVGPVTVNSVSPAWDGTKHGAMVNPDASLITQGYDTRIAGVTYSAGVRATFPLALSAGDSLISVESKASHATGGGATWIDRAAVLTVLAAPPAADAFRPPYVAGTKTIFRENDVNYGLLPGLAVPSGCTVPDMSIANGYINKVWLEHSAVEVGNALIFPHQHCSFSTNGYGYHRALQVSRMAALVLTNDAQAHSVANRLIQYGIDLQAQMAVNGSAWERNGGHGPGRLFPIIFAKTMLGAAWTIPYFVAGSSGPLKFQEEAYTYAGNDGLGGTVYRWGEICSTAGYTGVYGTSNHTCRSSAGTIDQYRMLLDGGAEGVNAGAYEACCNPCTYVGPALWARETGLFNWSARHAPFLPYTDRYVQGGLCDQIAADGYNSGLSTDFKIDANKYGGDGGKFMKRMWETYR